MLQERMKKYHFTQKSLARAVGAGMNQSKVSRILKGEQKPTLLQALRIEDLLGIPVRYWETVANDNETENESEGPE